MPPTAAPNVATPPERLRWSGGWWRRAARRPSPNQDARPPGEPVTLVVVHSISLPPGHYGGDAIENLFTNRLDPAAHPSFEALRGLRVSAHFLIRRDGRTLQFVPIERRAWHAGRSTWCGRAACNDFSVGIELEGLEGLTFEAAQYSVLADLLRDLRRRLPLADVTGHEHVAPERKRDPGPGFDWHGLRRRMVAHHAARRLHVGPPAQRGCAS